MHELIVLSVVCDRECVVCVCVCACVMCARANYVVDVLWVIV